MHEMNCVISTCYVVVPSATTGLRVRIGAVVSVTTDLSRVIGSTLCLCENIFGIVPMGQQECREDPLMRKAV